MFVYILDFISLFIVSVCTVGGYHEQLNADADTYDHAGAVTNANVTTLT
jgi:hypothetical protein